MNAEQNAPESHAAVAPPPSSSPESEGGFTAAAPATPGKSRRRRRKRKNNRPAGEAGANAAATGSNGAEGSVDVAAQAAPSEVQANPAQSHGSQRPRQNNQGHTQQAQGGGKRWKKKKGRGDGQARPEPGNSVQGSHAGQRGRNRKPQARGPRSFVGPMDHSYREVNGNYADTPASTIEIHGNNGHRRQNNHRRDGNEDRLPPELMTHHRAVAISEDAPTHIYFFIEDLFFTAKIQEAARQQGVKVAFVKPEKDIVAHLAELPEHDHPSLIVFDLNNAAAKPLTLIPKLKSKLKKGTSIVGFLSHLQGDLKAKAVEAGCNSVMPRAAFSQNLPNLLRRYGADDEHEPNYNM